MFNTAHGWDKVSIPSPAPELILNQQELQGIPSCNFPQDLQYKTECLKTKPTIHVSLNIHPWADTLKNSQDLVR